MYNHLPESTGQESSDPLQRVFENPSSFASLKGRNFLLDNFIEDKSVRREKRGAGKKTARKHFEVLGEEADFDLYMPLHELWKQYIGELLGNKCVTFSFSSANLAEKLVKADMHGAMISVWKSSCNTYRGHRGIVVQETRRSFLVVTPQNKVLRTLHPGLLKQDSVFLLEIGAKIAKIFGDHFQYQPAERSKLRLKQRITPKLLCLLP